jgi:hypothetical protein
MSLVSYLDPVNFDVATPCPGVMLRRAPETGAAVVWLHYTADPTMTEERLELERKRYTNQALFRREMEIDYDALSGQRVYPTFDPKVHVIGHDRIPKRMCRYMAIDPHPRTPHAFMWIGVDAWNDLYIYRENWESKIYGKRKQLTDRDEENEFFVGQYVEMIAHMEGNQIEWHGDTTSDGYGIYRRKPDGEKIMERFMDQAGKAFRASGENQVEESYAERYNRYGIECSDPYKSHRAGEDAVRELLRPRKHDLKGNWTRLHISDRCIETILEFFSYRYKITKRMNEERELKQEGVEARCHMLDLLRYLATSPNLVYYERHATEEYQRAA